MDTQTPRSPERDWAWRRTEQVAWARGRRLELVHDRSTVRNRRVVQLGVRAQQPLRGTGAGRVDGLVADWRECRGGVSWFWSGWERRWRRECRRRASGLCVGFALTCVPSVPCQHSANDDHDHDNRSRRRNCFPAAVFPLYRRRFRCLAIPPYYNLRFTKHAAFQQFSAPPFKRRSAPIWGGGYDGGASGDRSRAAGRRRRAGPCGAACPPRLVVALIGGQPRRSRPDRCVSPCPPASCTPRRWTPAPNSSRRNILRPRFRRSHPPAAGQAMRRTRLTVRPFSSSRSGILPTKSTRCGAARCASRCSPETQFS